MLASAAGFHCERVDWDCLLPERLHRLSVHLIIAVVEPLGVDTIAGFEVLRKHRVGTPTIAVLPRDAEEGLLRAAARMADDFILTPVGPRELRHRVERVLGLVNGDVESVSSRLREEHGLAELVGIDPAFLRVLERITRFARVDAPALITGETGTGKELCARSLHHLSKRRPFPFLAVDCGTLPEQLFENEMFGHTRGAYTDAHRDQRGLVAMAEGGTLFLDEIDTLSLPAQGKLLRFLQDRAYRRLGSDRFERANVNVIAATNRDLEAAVHAKQFRADLFFRLNVLRLHLPPLRERRGDIELLVRHFVEASGQPTYGRHLPFSPAAVRALASYDWPGNVRELQNVVIRALMEADGAQVDPCHLALPGGLPVADESSSFRAARTAALTAFERRYVEDLLRRHHGNVTHAAREARKDRRALGRLIKKHGISRLVP